MNDFIDLTDIERDVYGEQEYAQRHTPQLCCFVRSDGKLLYSKVVAPADVPNLTFSGEIFVVKRLEYVSGDFIDGKKSIKRTVSELQELGICHEEILAILHDLTDRKTPNGNVRRDNTASVAYKQPVSRTHNGREIMVFLAK